MSLLTLLLVLCSVFVLLLTHSSQRLRTASLPILTIYLVICTSFLIHAPFTDVPLGLMGLKYSDIVHGVFSARFSSELVGDVRRLSELWFDVGVFDNLVKKSCLCPIPYVDYVFEYPPVVGLLWFLTTCASFTMSSKLTLTVSEFFNTALSINYTLQSLILASFTVLTFHFIRRIALTSDRPLQRSLLLIVLPSTILYTTYNWDAVASGLAVASLYAFLKKRYFTSGTLLGLSVAGKILTGGLLIPLAFHLIRGIKSGSNQVRDLIMFSGGFLISGLGPFAILYALSTKGFITHHMSWYCENCIYALMIPDIFNPLHKYLYMLLGSTLLIVIAILSYRGALDVITLSYASVGGVVALNYIFTPQMILMVTPFALLALNRLLLYAYVIADVANSLLIMAFFEDATLRTLLSRLVPINTGFNPWTIDSPTQWLATIRNVAILTTITYTLIMNRVKR
ncbi:MAG: hypothetical protein QXP80_05510 [Zestosphaera sp.]